MSLLFFLFKKKKKKKAVSQNEWDFQQSEQVEHNTQTQPKEIIKNRYQPLSFEKKDDIDLAVQPKTEEEKVKPNTEKNDRSINLTPKNLREAVILSEILKRPNY